MEIKCQIYFKYLASDFYSNHFSHTHILDITLHFNWKKFHATLAPISLLLAM